MYERQHSLLARIFDELGHHEYDLFAGYFFNKKYLASFYVGKFCKQGSSR